MVRLRKRALFTVLAVLSGIATPCLILEMVLRFLPVASATQTMAVDEANAIVRFTPSQAFTYSKGWRFEIVNAGRINNYGFVNDQDYAKHGEQDPLVIIGDSYVEAMMVPYIHTVHGRLAALVGNERRVYSLGISGSQLAQYLAFAEYAWTEFHPQIMVFVVVGNDFDESLKKYKQAPGYYHFEEQGLNHELKLMRIDYRPSTGKKLLRHSALVRYLWGTVGVSAIAQWIKPAGDYVGNTAAYASESRLADSRRAVDQFFAELPRRVPLDRSRILFVLDAMRPGIYSDADLDRTAGSYFNLMRQHFLHSGEAHGYEVIDMQPRFIARHRKDGSRFEFATDNHWNSFGHEEVAAAVASSGVLKAFVPL